MFIFHRWILALLFAIAVVPVGHAEELNVNRGAPVLQDSLFLDRDANTPISIMVLHREGANATAQTLQLLDQESDVRIRIDGDGHFLYRRYVGGEVESLKDVSYRSNRVIIPTVVPPAYPEKAYLSISVDGLPVSDRIEVFQQTEAVLQVLQKIPAMRATVLRWVEGEYALVDQSLLDHEGFVRQYLANRAEYKRSIYALPDGTTMPMIELGKEDSKFEEAAGGLSRLVFSCTNPPCPRPCPWEIVLTLAIGQDYTTDYGCDYHLDPFGVVEWQMSFPQFHGFSYKSEFSNTMHWASGFFDILDGLYRSQWGCGTAIKVPDNVLMIAQPSVAVCCQGPIARVLNKRCTRENPAAIGWPNCPLF